MASIDKRTTQAPAKKRTMKSTPSQRSDDFAVFSVKAFRVLVVTLPIAAVDSMNFALASSLGNSEMITASYIPMVKYQAWIFPPAASAAFLAASSRAGLSLIFAAPCCVYRTSET
jgi:hypothetical protein